jgi:hypothetical protein
MYRYIFRGQGVLSSRVLAGQEARAARGHSHFSRDIEEEGQPTSHPFLPPFHTYTTRISLRIVVERLSLRQTCRELSIPPRSLTRLEGKVARNVPQSPNVQIPSSGNRSPLSIDTGGCATQIQIK